MSSICVYPNYTICNFRIFNKLKQPISLVLVASKVVFCTTTISKSPRNMYIRRRKSHLNFSAVTWALQEARAAVGTY